ncbi:hypothetical protein D3C72_610940 [compost metagenome]
MVPMPCISGTHLKWLDSVRCTAHLLREMLLSLTPSPGKTSTVTHVFMMALAPGTLTLSNMECTPAHAIEN